MKFFFQRLTCFFFGHDWYIVDYLLGSLEEGNKTWNIKECDRCRKAELD